MWSVREVRRSPPPPPSSPSPPGQARDPRVRGFHYQDAVVQQGGRRDGCAPPQHPAAARQQTHVATACREPQRLAAPRRVAWRCGRGRVGTPQRRGHRRPAPECGRAKHPPHQPAHVCSPVNVRRKAGGENDANSHNRDHKLLVPTRVCLLRPLCARRAREAGPAIKRDCPPGRERGRRVRLAELRDNPCAQLGWGVGLGGGPARTGRAASCPPPFPIHAPSPSTPRWPRRRCCPP